MRPFLESDKPEIECGSYVYIKSLETVINESRKYRYHFNWSDQMFKYCGKKARVIDVVKTNEEGMLYTLDVDHRFFNWHKTMFDYGKTTRRFVENE